MTTFITIRPEALAVAESLRAASLAANACGGTVAQQDGAYGIIAEAMIRTLASAFKDDMPPAHFPERLALAREIYEECLYNGEDVAYCIQIVDDRIKARLEDERAARVEQSYMNG